MSIQNTRIVVTGVKDESDKFSEFLLYRNEANAQILKLATEARRMKRQAARVLVAQKRRNDAKRVSLLRRQAARVT